METQTLLEYLDSFAQAKPWLRSLGVADLERAHANLVSFSRSGLTTDLAAVLADQLAEHLPGVSDPDMALNNLDRYLAAARNPLSVGALFERDAEALPTLLQILSSSQYLADVLVRDPAGFELVRLTDGAPLAKPVLVDELCAEVIMLDDEAAALLALRRFKHRETMRIAFGDIVRRQNIETVTRQISYLAEAICEAALRFVYKKLAAKRGQPRSDDGSPARFVVLALGKLGGRELNYSSDIDLIFLCEEAGSTDGARPVANSEFFERLARGLIKLLSESTELGAAYRTDMRLRPDGRQGPIVIDWKAALRYYDVKGRTWERQAFVKARPIAGDLELGEMFLSQLEPWVYRRYLNRADITGIKALKRRIEKRNLTEGGEFTDVKTGQGGIRDIEFAIQFLLLLNGGDLQKIRTGNTLEAIERLEQAGCLTMQERTLLTRNYEFLRRVEHRLQIMFDLQTHSLPSHADELRKLALRLGGVDTEHTTALEAFQEEYRTKTAENRKILDHLLHDAFGGEEKIAQEVDLVLDPDPPEHIIRDVLAPYGFSDVPAAYANLMALAEEKIPFLSTRRCRHFLASIAPQLLEAISASPDPDSALLNLSAVSDSVGGKGVLWELFSFNAPSLLLYVQLCATSPYLSHILTSNPGMIDELMDSLVLAKLPSREALERNLAELCQGAEDIEPILHSFKSSQHLRVGVRDILGKDDVQTAHQTLSDIAQVCLAQVARIEYEKLTTRFGRPMRAGGKDACELIILAMGKLGGREPNYHSDLDVVFLYEAEGQTQPLSAQRADRITTNQHFFSQLAQKITKVITKRGPYGRLYELDARLRPTGKSGALAVSLPEFSRYFSDGRGQLWERQALCKARVVYGSADVQAVAMQAVRQAITTQPWTDACRQKIHAMRMRLEETAARGNLKRGRGGTVDIEFIVQMLQLKYARQSPEVLQPGTLAALEQLLEANHISADDYEYFRKAYRFLRSVEARLRLMDTSARHDLPHDELELRKLAYLLGYANSQDLLTGCGAYLEENRRRFERFFGTA